VTGGWLFVSDGRPARPLPRVPHQRCSRRRADLLPGGYHPLEGSPPAFIAIPVRVSRDRQARRPRSLGFSREPLPIATGPRPPAAAWPAMASVSSARAAPLIPRVSTGERRSCPTRTSRSRLWQEDRLGIASRLLRNRCGRLLLPRSQPHPDARLRPSSSSRQAPFGLVLAQRIRRSAARTTRVTRTDPGRNGCDGFEHIRFAGEHARTTCRDLPQWCLEPGEPGSRHSNEKAWNG
jgi:hypothetical protein